MRLLDKNAPLIIASHNAHKIIEIKSVIGPYFPQLLTANDIELPEPVEDGDCYVANATIKARAGALATGKPVLAEDSGMGLNALDGKPGLDTAPFSKTHGGWEHAALVLWNELGDKDKTALFTSVIALGWPDGHVDIFESVTQGQYVYPARGNDGFGFNPHFIPDGETRTYGETSLPEKNETSPRAASLRKFLQSLQLGA